MARSFVSTTNPCKMCRPLGACLAFRGIEDSMMLLHGAQGCSTYMRRYISSHFREPVDIASSSLSEKGAIYGGEANLRQGIRNVTAKYSPSVLGVATTCLTETIGDDVEMIIGDLCREDPSLVKTVMVPVSTPSYSGSHTDGFHDACVALLDKLSQGGKTTDMVNIFPGFLSPADIRYLKRIMHDYGCRVMIMPDISETLDAGIEESYKRIPSGGTPIEQVVRAGSSSCSIEFNITSAEAQSAAVFLDRRFGVPAQRLPLPIGIRNSDLFVNTLERATGKQIPPEYKYERSRLLDAMVDAHKYLFGKRAVVYGDADFVTGMTSFLVDVGVVPVICASGGGGAAFEAEIGGLTSEQDEAPEILKKADFDDIMESAQNCRPDLLIGNSKGNYIARKLGLPLVRAGFPVHDRIGGQRHMHIFYRGAIELLDYVTNIIIANEEEKLGYGYSYM